MVSRASTTSPSPRRRRDSFYLPFWPDISAERGVHALKFFSLNMRVSNGPTREDAGGVSFSWGHDALSKKELERAKGVERWLMI